MKPRNFPGRVLRRQAGAKWRAGVSLTPAESKALQAPKDIRIRVGVSRRERRIQSLEA